jgi:alkylhydroperoxidase family enzyme
LALASKVMREVDFCMRYRSLHENLKDAVLDTPGHTSEGLRRAVLDHAAGGHDGVPLGLRNYVGKVTRHAYKVTDADIAGLKQAGYSDDVVFEITVAAAVGAAMHRLQRGMAALRGD